MTHRDARPRPNPYPWLALIAAVLVFGWLWVRSEPVASTPVQHAAPTSTPGPDRVADALETANALHATEMAPPTSTAIPTMYPTAKADPYAQDCDRITPRAGVSCRMPPLPTNTPMPEPDCPTTPGRWCVWPDRDETSGEAVTR